MQRRSRSADLALHLLLFVLAIVGISAGLSVDASAQTGPSASSADNYILGPNDRIRLKVYGESDITGEYEINNTGQVSIPLAGHIKAAGSTTRQLEKAIASALAKGIVRDPRVNVEVAQYRPYYILGEVKKSGEYPYRHGLTVLDAVASAADSPIAPTRTRSFYVAQAPAQRRAIPSMLPSRFIRATTFGFRNATSSNPEPQISCNPLVNERQRVCRVVDIRTFAMRKHFAARGKLFPARRVAGERITSISRLNQNLAPAYRV